MLPVIAVFRLSENEFRFYDLNGDRFSDPFSVEESDTYLQMSYSRLTFSEYDQAKCQSTELISVSLSEDSSEEQALIVKDLPPEKIAEMARAIYSDLGLAYRSENQPSMLKH